MKKPIAYVAGPLGFSEAGRYFLQQKLVPLIIEAGFDVRDPWSLTPPEIIESARSLPYGPERREKWKSVNRVIGSKNIEGIEESDVVIAVLDGSDVDSGTAGEIGYGAARGKTIIGYRSDFRLSADNEGSMINLQIEYFIYLNGGEIVRDLQSLKKALLKFKDQFVWENTSVI